MPIDEVLAIVFSLLPCLHGIAAYLMICTAFNGPQLPFYFQEEMLYPPRSHGEYGILEVCLVIQER